MSNDLDPAVASPPKQTAVEEHLTQIRPELLRLSHDLEQVQKEFDAAHSVQLLEANEKLVLAAVLAERIAEEAMDKLRDLTQVTQHDALTETPNRALMLDRIQSAIAIAKRRQTRFAVLFIDIDHFKHINDTYGHAMGDQALQQVARRLESAVRGSDTVSRHSGDEFVVLLSEISQASDAARIATKMLDAVATPEDTQAQPFSLSISIGIAIYPDHGITATSLIARADVAMYRSKRRGGACFQLHGMDDRVSKASLAKPISATPREAAHGPEPDTFRTLRDANEQLVLCALGLHEAELRSHDQQIKFLAMVAHELRNPLAPIHMAADLLNRFHTNNKESARLQEVIQSQVAHMARIVDDLLDGSRVSLGKFHLECSTIDIIDILKLTLDACGPGMDARHQNLNTQLPIGPLYVYGDPVRLAQIFRNLLDNASKYTPEGGSISLTAVVADESIVITVSDNGIGIAPELLPDIFDLFVQEAHAVTMDGTGLGVGLAVVHELVGAHAGRVVVSSAGHDLGSTFTVTLPLKAKRPTLSA